MTKKKVTFFDLLPYFLRDPDNDPTGAIRTFADALQSIHDRIWNEVADHPLLLSPDSLNHKPIVSGAVGFDQPEQQAAGKVLSAQGLSNLLLQSPQIPTSNALNGYGIYIASGAYTGFYAVVEAYIYNPLAAYPFVAQLDRPLPGEIATNVQIVLGIPDRVWLPSEASDIDEFYTAQFVRVEGGPQGSEPQIRKIVGYAGASRLASVSPAFSRPPAPGSVVGVIPFNVPLQYLARHVGLKLPSNLPEALKRQLILHAIEVYRLKGTRAGFEVLLRLLGWDFALIELGQTYAHPQHPLPPWDFTKKGGSTSITPRDGYLGKDHIYPYKQGGFAGLRGVAYQHPDQPEHLQFSTTTPLLLIPSVTVQPNSALPSLHFFTPALALTHLPAQVTAEVMAIVNGNATGPQLYGRTNQIPLGPGTVSITAMVSGSPCVFVDDGAGKLSQASGPPQTIQSYVLDYLTGFVILDLAATITSATITYQWGGQYSFLTNGFVRLPDSDIEIYVAPSRPSVGPLLPSALQDLLVQMEDVRPIHVEISAIGFLVKIEETATLEEEFDLTVIVAPADTISISETIVSFTAEFSGPAESGPLAEALRISRELRWDVTLDHWDGGTSQPLTHDTGVIVAVG